MHLHERTHRGSQHNPDDAHTHTHGPSPGDDEHTRRHTRRHDEDGCHDEGGYRQHELPSSDSSQSSSSSDSGVDDEAMLAAQLSSDEENGSPNPDTHHHHGTTVAHFDPTPTAVSTAKPTGKFGLKRSEMFFNEYLGHTDLKSFVYNPIPQNRLALCKITRTKGSKSRYPVFTMTFEDANGEQQRDVLVAKRQRHGKAISYLIATDKSELDASPSGKLKANFGCSKFSLYDNGCKRAKSRKEIGNIVYTHKSWSNPRGLLIRCPYEDANGRQRDVCMVNALPEWDPVLKIHSLKFNGRATEVSVKNFKLIRDGVQSSGGSADSDDDAMFFLRLGKISKDTFNVDYRWPMTPLQAFGIALTSFEGGRAR